MKLSFLTTKEKAPEVEEDYRTVVEIFKRLEQRDPTEQAIFFSEIIHSVGSFALTHPDLDINVEVPDHYQLPTTMRSDPNNALRIVVAQNLIVLNEQAGIK